MLDLVLLYDVHMLLLLLSLQKPSGTFHIVFSIWNQGLQSLSSLPNQMCLSLEVGENPCKFLKFRLFLLQFTASHKINHSKIFLWFYV